MPDNDSRERREMSDAEEARKFKKLWKEWEEINKTLITEKSSWDPISDIVKIPDPRLKKAMQEECGIKGELTKSNLEGITKLFYQGSLLGDITKNLINIEGIQYCINIEDLDLSFNEISNLKPLENLINIRKLDIMHNKISDINCLSKLVNVEELHLGYTYISDLKGLENMRKMKRLDLIYINSDKFANWEILKNMKQIEDFSADSSKFPKKYLKNGTDELDQIKLFGDEEKMENKQKEYISISFSNKQIGKIFEGKDGNEYVGIQLPSGSKYEYGTFVVVADKVKQSKNNEKMSYIYVSKNKQREIRKSYNVGENEKGEKIYETKSVRLTGEELKSEMDSWKNKPEKGDIDDIDLDLFEELEEIEGVFDEPEKQQVEQKTKVKPRR